MNFFLFFLNGFKLFLFQCWESCSSQGSAGLTESRFTHSILLLYWWPISWLSLDKHTHATCIFDLPTVGFLISRGPKLNSNGWMVEQIHVQLGCMDCWLGKWITEWVDCHCYRLTEENWHHKKFGIRGINSVCLILIGKSIQCPSLRVPYGWHRERGWVVCGRGTVLWAGKTHSVGPTVMPFLWAGFGPDGFFPRIYDIYES